MGITMLGLTRLQCAAAALLVAGAVSLTAGSAWAFRKESVSSGGSGNATFTDPDDHTTSSTQGAHPFGLNGPTVQFGAQQGSSASTFGHFQGDGYNGRPPDPYFRPLNGN
ncbi:MAG: hypothetical protein WB495_08895 [Xanthobacteraceae bacterium]